MVETALAHARAPWRLTDLIDVQALQEIQDTFARAFGLPTVIVHPDGTDVTDFTNRLPFCEDLTRTSAVGGPRCAGCDRRALHEAGESGRPSIFECWNGLYDAAVPIAPKGRVLGYFLCGQVLTSAPDPERYRATAAEIGVPADRYVDALGDVRVVPFERYEASVQSMHVLAQMIADQAAASIDALRMLEGAERAREDAAQLMEELESILDGLREVGSQPDHESTLEAIADTLARLIPSDSCVIYVLSDDGAELVPAVVRDPYADAVRRHRPRVGHGVLGKAAVDEAGRRFTDVTQDPDFEHIPGVPLEPESLLVVPMTYRGVTSGAIALSRFERRVFSDHDLRVLRVFSAQASVAVQVSRLGGDRARRLREEQAMGRLLRATTARSTVRSILAEVAQVGIELLGAGAAVVRARSGAGPVRLAVGADDDEARRLLDAAGDGLGGDLTVTPDPTGGASLLRLGLGRTGEEEAVAVLVGPPGHEWDRRLARAYAAQAALGIEQARLRDREQQALTGYQRLSELGTALVDARDEEEVAERLLARTPAVFSAPAAWIATLDGGPDAIEVRLGRGGPSGRRLTVHLDGPARVAALRLRDERAPDSTLFDAWARGVFAAVARDAGLASFAAEPLTVGDGTLGGLFAGWTKPDVRPSEEHRRMLGVLAGAAGASLARFAAHQQTDSSLRARVAELEGLTQLAQRITGLADEDPIVEELLTAFRRIGRTDGALFGVRARGGVDVRAAHCAPDVAATVAAAVRDAELSGRAGRPLIAGDDGSVLVLPVRRAGRETAVLAGVVRAGEDRDRDRALTMLARFGAVALENAGLHDRRRQAIADLERRQLETAEQKDALERILSVHHMLAGAVLEGRGMSAVVESLGRFLDAELLVLGPHGRVLAGWPEGAEIGWRPPPSGGSPRTLVEVHEGRHLVAAPAVMEGRLTAWVIARAAGPPDEIARAAAEYGALLAALDVLRERTAVEIETRLRGGLVEELVRGGFAEERMVEQALALGLDLREPARVHLVEPASGDVQPEDFFATVAGCARRSGAANLVAIRGGGVVAVVAEPAGGDGPRFEDLMRADLLRQFPEGRFSIGVGTACAAPADHRRSFAAARRGVDLLRMLDRCGETFSFRGATLETMLLQSVEPEAAAGFVARYVDPLDRYDAGHASELRRTLEVYFAAGTNLEETARRLFVHVSTLRYRLKKVAELTGIDLREPGARLDLQVALKVAAVLGATRVTA